MVQRFRNAFVAVLQLHVFPNQTHLDGALGVLVTAEEVTPLVEVGRRVGGVHAQLAQHHFVEFFLLHQQGHVVDGVRVDALNHSVCPDVAEPRQLGAHVGGQRVFGAADQDVRLHPKLKELLDRVLGGFGFQFPCSRQVRHECQVHHQGVLGAFPLHLTHSLDVGQGFNVPHGSADFCDHEVVVLLGAQDLDTTLDLVGDVRDDLNGLAQVFPTTLFVDDALVDASSGDVVGLGGLNVEETLVVAQIQICLRTVNRHVAFPVLVRVQRARVHIDVRVQLLDGHGVPARLEQLGQGGTDNALAQAAAHTASDKNVPAVPAAGQGVGGRRSWSRHVPHIRDSKVDQSDTSVHGRAVQFINNSSPCIHIPLLRGIHALREGLNPRNFLQEFTGHDAD